GDGACHDACRASALRGRPPAAGGWSSSRRQCRWSSTRADGSRRGPKRGRAPRRGNARLQAEHEFGRHGVTRKKKPTASPRALLGGRVVFVAASGVGGVEAVYADENVWLSQKSQKRMAQLYDVEVPTINTHLKKVFKDSEFEARSVIRNFRRTAADARQAADQGLAGDGLYSFAMRSPTPTA